MSKTLTDALNEMSALVNSVAENLSRTGTSPIAINLTTKALTPVLHGIVVAHVEGTPPAEIEDALINIFTIGLVELLKRQHKPDAKLADVQQSIQQVINFAAETLTDQLSATWGPKIITPNDNTKLH